MRHPPAHPPSAGSRRLSTPYGEPALHTNPFRAIWEPDTGSTAVMGRRWRQSWQSVLRRRVRPNPVRIPTRPKVAELSMKPPRCRTVMPASLSAWPSVSPFGCLARALSRASPHAFPGLCPFEYNGLKRLWTQERTKSMKPTGFVRTVDHLGRVCLPRPLLHTLHIANNDSIELYVQGGRVVLKPYRPSCIFCGQEDNTQTFRGQTICADCLHRLPITAD